MCVESVCRGTVGCHHIICDKQSITYILRSNRIIVYYVPRQSNRCLYEDEEFNDRTEGEDDKTASEYKQLDCLGTYDT